MRIMFIIWFAFTLFTTHDVVADDDSACWYLPTSTLEPVEKKTCIAFDKLERKLNHSDVIISEQVLKHTSYNSDGIAYLYSTEGPFYFLKSGKARRTIYYDNGPDYFNEGLARTHRQGKIGFFNKQLDIVIPPRYDFAYPFNNGITLVCNGCVIEQGDDHSTVVGGEWGAINIRGEVIVPIKFDKKISD